MSIQRRRRRIDVLKTLKPHRVSTRLCHLSTGSVDFRKTYDSVLIREKRHSGIFYAAFGEYGKVNVSIKPEEVETDDTANTFSRTIFQMFRFYLCDHYNSKSSYYY